MEALRRVTRYLLGTQDAFVKLRIQSADPITVELVGYLDSDWAGDLSSRKSQSCGHVEADGCPLKSFSRRQSCVATSSNGGVRRDVMYCRGTAALAIVSGTLRIQIEHDPVAILCLREALRNVPDWVKSRRWR